MPHPDSSPHVLLVEGVDDKHVVGHLCGCMANQICIIDKGSVEKVLKSIGSELRAPGRKTLGILVDANDCLRSRWYAVTDRLRQSDIVVPTKPDPSGTIIDGSPRIGIWLMPNNAVPGELENFVAGMIPENDAVWPLSTAYVDRIPMADRKFKPGKLLRAEVHSWLATREEPRKMGSAIGAGDLNVCAPDAAKLLQWLRRLFVSTPTQECGAG